MEALILIIKIIVMGIVCGTGATILALTLVLLALSFYAFMLNLFSDDKDY